MVICLCRRVREDDIHRQVAAGCVTFEALQRLTGVATGCGVCTDCAREVFNEERLQRAEAGTEQGDACRLRHRRPAPLRACDLETSINSGGGRAQATHPHA